MTKHTGGDNVKPGVYWNIGKWEATLVRAGGGMLPGSATDRYMRLPLLALVVLAPTMGAVFAMFLPAIGAVMLIAFLLGRLKKSGRHTPPAVEAEEKRAA